MQTFQRRYDSIIACKSPPPIKLVSHHNLTLKSSSTPLPTPPRKPFMSIPPG